MFKKISIYSDLSICKIRGYAPGYGPGYGPKDVPPPVLATQAFTVSYTNEILVLRQSSPGKESSHSINFKWHLNSINQAIFTLPDNVKKQVSQFWDDTKERFTKEAFVSLGQSTIKAPFQKLSIDEKKPNPYEDNLNTLFSFIFKGDSFEHGIRNFIKIANHYDQVSQFLEAAFGMLGQCLNDKEIQKLLTATGYGSDVAIKTYIQEMPNYPSYQKAMQSLETQTKGNLSSKIKNMFSSHIQNKTVQQTSYVPTQEVSEELWTIFYEELACYPPDDGILSFRILDITKSKGLAIACHSTTTGISPFEEPIKDQHRVVVHGDTHGNATMALLDQITHGAFNFTKKGLKEFSVLFSTLVKAEKDLCEPYFAWPDEVRRIRDFKSNHQPGSNKYKEYEPQHKDLMTKTSNYTKALEAICTFIETSKGFTPVANVSNIFLGDNQGDRSGTGSMDYTWQRLWNSINTQRTSNGLPPLKSIFGNHESFCLEDGHPTANSFFATRDLLFYNSNIPIRVAYLTFFKENLTLVQAIESNGHVALLTHALPEASTFMDLIQAFKNADSSLDITAHLTVIKSLEDNKCADKEAFFNMIIFINQQFRDVYLHKLILHYKDPKNKDLDLSTSLAKLNLSNLHKAIEVFIWRDIDPDNNRKNKAYQRNGKEPLVLSLTYQNNQETEVTQVYGHTKKQLTEGGLSFDNVRFKTSEQSAHPPVTGDVQGNNPDIKIHA